MKKIRVVRRGYGSQPTEDGQWVSQKTAVDTPCLIVESAVGVYFGTRCGGWERGPFVWEV